MNYGTGTGLQLVYQYNSVFPTTMLSKNQVLLYDVQDYWSAIIRIIKAQNNNTEVCKIMAQNSFAAHWKIEHMKIVGKQTRVKKKIFEGNQTNLSILKSNCLFRGKQPFICPSEAVS